MVREFSIAGSLGSSVFGRELPFSWLVAEIWSQSLLHENLYGAFREANAQKRAPTIPVVCEALLLSTANLSAEICKKPDEAIVLNEDRYGYLWLQKNFVLLLQRSASFFV